VCWPPVPSPSNWGCIIVLRLLNSWTAQRSLYPVLHPMDYGSIQPLTLWHPSESLVIYVHSFWSIGSLPLENAD
jgi:hypothetical protein